MLIVCVGGAFRGYRLRLGRGMAVCSIHRNLRVCNCGGVAGVGAARPSFRLLQVSVRAEVTLQAAALERLLLDAARHRLPPLSRCSVRQLAQIFLVAKFLGFPGFTAKPLRGFSIVCAVEVTSFGEAGFGNFAAAAAWCCSSRARSSPRRRTMWRTCL